MKKRMSWLCLLLVVSCLSLVIDGCAKPTRFADVVRFNLLRQPTLPTTEILGESFYVYNNKSQTVTFAPFLYEKLVIIYIRIANQTSTDLGTAEYGIELTDGRDQLLLKRITENDLTAIQQKIANPQGFNLMSPSLQGAMGTVNSLMSFPANSQISDQLKRAVEQYFAFRPIYAQSTRQGFIAFYHDFNLEYPLGLKLRLGDDNQAFYFYPKKQGEK